MSKTPKHTSALNPPAKEKIRESWSVTNQRSLKVRHLTMMGLGSAIGAGLFIGSGKAVALAGPGILISYLLAGFIVVLVMRMLGELGAALPHSSSFSYYAHLGIGRWAGFICGWLYWYLLVLVLGAELTAASQIISTWTKLPTWIIALIAVIIFGAINLSNLRLFGEFEFWFAAIKVAVIILFILIGILMVAGVIGSPTTSTPNISPGFHNLIAHGGFFPHGLSGITAGLLVVAFAFGGIEIVTIAAAESENPMLSIGRAVTSVIWRISIFYLGSIAIMVLVLPWNDPRLTQPAGPFSAVLQLAGIPGAAQAMEVVVVLALLSAFNAQIYATSRMSASLSQRGDGPACLARLDKNGAPRLAISLSVGISLIGVLLNYLDNGALLNFLLNAVGASLLVIWTFICIAEIRLRPRLEKEGKLIVKMWLFPYLSYLTLVLLAGLGILMLLSSEARPQLLGLLVVVIVFLLLFTAIQRYQKKSAQTPKTKNL